MQMSLQRGWRWTCVACAIVLAVSLGPTGAMAQKAAATQGAPRTATWEELVPKDWDPMKSFRELDVATVREGSAREQALMRELRESWDNAPTRSELNGAKIRLPGYVVPLEMGEGGRLSQFLLVPYFGACIHTPPPPANQIVH